MALWLACVASPAAGTARTDPQASTGLVDKGIKLLADGKFLEAVAVFNRLKQAAPNDPQPYFYSGLALTEAGKLSEAALQLGEAVRLDPKRPEFLIFHANVLTLLGQKAHATEALRVFDLPGGTRGVATAVLWVLADVYGRLDRTDDSQRILDQLKARTPGDARIDLKRGQIHLASGQPGLAERYIRDSIRKEPRNAVAQYELGKILYQRNEIAASKGALLAAVREDPDNPEYLHRLGLVCLALDELDEAALYLTRAEPHAGRYPQIYYALGNVSQRKGDRESAKTYRKKYQEVILALRAKEDRDREVARLMREAEQQLDQGEQAQAQSLFEQVLRLEADHWDAHGYIAEILLSSADPRGALEHLQRMEVIDPESTVGQYLMARYWYRAREFEKARTYAERVKQVQPGHAPLRNLLGEIYRALGDEGRALQEYEAAVQLAPDRADFRESLRRLKERDRRVPRRF